MCVRREGAATGANNKGATQPKGPNTGKRETTEKGTRSKGSTMCTTRRSMGRCTHSTMTTIRMDIIKNMGVMSSITMMSMAHLIMANTIMTSIRTLIIMSRYTFYMIMHISFAFCNTLCAECMCMFV